jgi:hypothetical protein
MITTDMGHFKIAEDTQHNVLVINGPTRLRFTPGEKEACMHIVSLALGMRNSEALPPLIRHDPFAVDFSADGVFVLRRANEREGVKFSFETGNDLIRSIEAGADKVVDAIRIQGGVTAGAAVRSSPEVPIDGR